LIPFHGWIGETIKVLIFQMDKVHAMKLVEKIKSLCDKGGVWYKDEYDNKPELKMIFIGVSIKVDKEAGTTQ